jgi:hypothetical protein
VRAASQVSAALLFGALAADQEEIGVASIILAIRALAGKDHSSKASAERSRAAVGLSVGLVS